MVIWNIVNWVPGMKTKMPITSFSPGTKPSAPLNRASAIMQFTLSTLKVMLPREQ